MLVITVSRQTGSLGDEIAGLLSEKLGIRLITHSQVSSEWLPEVATKYDMDMLKESPKHYINKSKEGISFAEYIELRLKEEADKQPLIILGLGAQAVFDSSLSVLKIRVGASIPVRIDRVKKMYGLDSSEAERFIELSDRRHKKYLKTIFDKDWAEPSLYDISLNTDNLSADEAVNMLVHLIEQRSNILMDMESPTINSTGHESRFQKITFVHPAEEEFAKILDMYNIEWQYEPKTFPTEWDAEGNVIKAFTPDFYLPRFNTYIEITIMDQKYVSEKKRKVRRLKELYPDININIVFKRDFHSLLRRFGLIKGVDNK